MNTSQYALQGEKHVSVAFEPTGIVYRNIIGRSFSFAFEEGVLLGTIQSVYVDLEGNIEISISNSKIGWNKKITSLRWDVSVKQWKLFYSIPCQIPDSENFTGEFKLL